MPHKDPEKRKEYDREYRQKNKDKIAEQMKEWRLKNKDKRLEYQKEYREKNKDKVKEYYQTYKEYHKEYQKKYSKTEQGIKSTRISSWRKKPKNGGLGLIEPDIDELYEHYLNTTICDICDIELTYDRTTTNTTKCLDHQHETGEFRYILCHRCNINEKFIK